MSTSEATPSTPPLYDFLYRDPVRVPSLIAQLAGGLATQAEKATGENKAKEFGGGLKWLLELGTRLTFLSTDQNKVVTNPHDYLLFDLLNRLNLQGYISSDPTTAPPGSVVRASGDLQLVDGNLFSSMMGMISNPLGEAMGGDNPLGAALVRGFGGVVSGRQTPTLFIVHSQSGVRCGGALKADGG